MALTDTNYLRQLQALLPQGTAWTRDDSATLTQFLSALSAELARVDGRAWQLVEESDPRATAELFLDWERVAGLPDACAEAFGGAQTMAKRRAALLGKLATIGGQSPAYYIAVADALGYEITIDEFRPHSVDDVVDEFLSDTDWAHAWRVNEPPNSVGYLTVFDTVSDPLAWWGLEIIECVVGRLKPAHTVVLWGQISYSDDTPAADLYDDAAFYGRGNTIAAIDRLHALLHQTLSQPAYW